MGLRPDFKAEVSQVGGLNVTQKGDVMDEAAVAQIDDLNDTQSGDVMDKASAPMDEQTRAGVDTKNPSIKDIFLSPYILEQLDAYCVPHELLETQTMQEKKALAPGTASLKCADGPVLQPQIRFITLNFLSHIAQQVNLAETSWFEAVTLLDMYHLKTRDPGCILDAIATLPATCAALVSILKKNDDATELVEGSCFVQHASLFAQRLQQSGYPTVNTKVTAGMINVQERRVLEALSWRIRVSTTESWASTYVSRFNVLSQSLLTPSLKWVWQQSILGARFLMMQQAVNPEQPPRVLAAGLLGIGLVGAGLLPLQAIQPDELSFEEWQKLYSEIKQRQPEPHCAIPEGHWQNLLGLFTAAVGTDLSMVKRACHLACISMSHGWSSPVKLGACPGTSAKTTSGDHHVGSDGGSTCASASD